MALSTFDCSVVSTSITNKLHEQLLKNTLKLMNYIMLLPFTYKQLKQITILRKTVKKKKINKKATNKSQTMIIHTLNKYDACINHGQACMF